jgi:uncharacterized damage-inducible protein DinB
MKKGITVLLLVAGIVATAQAQSGPSQFHSEFLNTFNASAEKIGGLASAIPEANYSWRPAEGVRSVSESLMHVASANYFIAGMLGAKVPEGLDVSKLESTVKTQSEAVKHLNNSFEFVRNAVRAMPEAALKDEVDLFGNKATKMSVAFLLADHMAEHLGQLIAYARMNNVTPPWSN